MGIFENSSNAASRMMSDGRELLNQGRKTDNNSSSNENEQPPGAGAKSSESPDEGLSNRPRGMRLFLVVFALLLTMFLIALDMTIVSTAIPVITDEFHSVGDIGWYASGFFITLAVFQSTWGKVYQYFDLKFSFLTSVLLFEVGSLICGVAQNSVTLIVGRAVAGLGGAGVTGGIYTIIAFIVPPEKVPRYIGLVGAVFSVASVAGPLLGGVFTGEITWRWCFYLNLPVGAVAVVLVFVLFHTPDAIKPVPISTRDLIILMDIPGLALSLGLLICFTLAMQWGGTAKAWSSPDVVGTLVGFLVMTLAFALIQWRSGDRAMLVARVLKQRTVWAVSLFIFFLNSTNFLLIYNLPEYFQIINGLSATDSGIRNLPLILASALSSLAGGYLLGRVGIYPVFLLVSSALLTLGAGLVYTLNPTSGLGAVIGYQIIVGIGVGSGIQVPVSAAQAFSPPQDIPLVTGVVLFFQLISGAICVSASHAVLSNRFIAALASLAPELDPREVLAAGGTNIRNVYHGAQLEHIVDAFMTGIKDSWAMSIALAGVTFIVAFAGEWKSMKGFSNSWASSIK